MEKAQPNGHLSSFNVTKASIRAEDAGNPNFERTNPFRSWHKKKSTRSCSRVMTADVM